MRLPKVPMDAAVARFVDAGAFSYRQLAARPPAGVKEDFPMVVFGTSRARLAAASTAFAVVGGLLFVGPSVAPAQAATTTVTYDTSTNTTVDGAGVLHSGTFTVPSGVTSLTIVANGAGGGGGSLAPRPRCEGDNVTTSDTR